MSLLDPSVAPLTHNRGVPADDKTTKMTWGVTITARDGTQHVFEPGTVALKATSPFGGAFLASIPGSDGIYAFDRLVLQEAPGAICVVWRNHHEKGVQLLLRDEGRPVAEIVAGVTTTSVAGFEHVVFAHSPMGFSDRFGKVLEDAFKVALRETTEEIGAVTVLDVCSPSDLIPDAFDSIYMNPTCCVNASSKIVFMRIKGEPGTPLVDRHDIPGGWNWYSLEEIESIKGKGFTPTGACIRQGPFMAALAAFEGCLPHLLERAKA